MSRIEKTTKAQDTGAHKATALSKPKSTKSITALASTTRTTRARGNTHAQVIEGTADGKPAEDTTKPKRKQRRSKAEMEVARAAAQEAAAAKITQRSKSLQTVADLENDLAREDATTATPRNAVARAVNAPSVPDFEDTTSELTETLTSDNEHHSDFEDPPNRPQINQRHDTAPSVKGKGKGVAKTVEAEHEEFFDLELTPVAKKSSSKVKGTRAAINTLRLTGDTDYDQKNVKQTQEPSKLVISFCLHH